MDINTKSNHKVNSTVTIFPAKYWEIESVGHMVHADSWNDESTLEISNEDFHTLITHLHLVGVIQVPGYVRIQPFRISMVLRPGNTHEKILMELCNKAGKMGAQFIAFS